VFYSVSIIILLSAYLFPTEAGVRADVSVSIIPIALSVLLLVPIYVWQRRYRSKTRLTKEISTRDESATLFWLFALFVLAMTLRIPSALLFGKPYEKTPLIYLLILTILIIEGTDLSAFGFKTEGFGKALLYGLAFFAVLSGLTLAVSYGLVHAFTGQIPVQSFDITSSLLSMPFMTLCVGISEEGLFRGYMQTHLERAYTTGTAIFMQALLFGVWHFVWNLTPFSPIDMMWYIANTFFMGLVFGYFYSKTRNLVPLILAHGLWNSIPPWIIENSDVLAYFYNQAPAEYQILMLILPLTVSAIVTVLFVKYLVRKA